MKKIPYIIIAVLLALLILQRECVRPPEVEPCPEIDTTYITDTVFKVDTIYEPEIIYQDTGSLILVPVEVDSLQIILSYFTTRIYLDTLINDTTAFVVIKDTVRMNEIAHRTILDLIIYPKTKFITKTVQLPPVRRGKLFLGVGVGRSVDQFGLTANLMYQTKRDNAYQLSYDVLNDDLYFTMFWKLKIRKNGKR